MVLAELKQQPVFTEPEIITTAPAKKKKSTSVRKANLLMFNLVVFVIAFSVIGVALYVQSALLGYEIVELKEEITALENENNRIEYTIAELSSLERIQVEAETKLGMFRPQTENMLAMQYEPPVTEVTPGVPQTDSIQQAASLKKDYQVISSILSRVGIANSF